jgi:hypothetical protein
MQDVQPIEIQNVLNVYKRKIILNDVTSHILIIDYSTKISFCQINFSATRSFHANISWAEKIKVLATWFKVFLLSTNNYWYFYEWASEPVSQSVSEWMNERLLLTTKWELFHLHRGRAKQKNMCASDRPTDPKILPPTLTFLCQKNNRSAKSGNSSLFPCLFPTSTIDAWLLRCWRFLISV